MDDLEKAILISFDESGSIDSVLKSQAIDYCQRIKGTPNISSICIERLWITKLVQVQFWCLQCLHDAIRVRHSQMGLEEKAFIRKSVFSMACYEGIDSCKNLVARVLDSPPFIKNKLAQVLVSLIYLEYPMEWSLVFVNFLRHLSKGAVVIDMFCRVLNALDDELISLDCPRNAEEIAVSGRIKDAMREQCVPQIVRAWYDIVSAYKTSDSELCANVLDSMRRCISWIDIGLIANNVFIPLFFELILTDGLLGQLRCAAADCVLAVVSKRMESQSKLVLLQSLQINRVFVLASKDADSKLVSNLAELLTGYSTEALDCCKRISSADGKQISMMLLDEVLPSVFYLMQNCDMDGSFSVIQFLSGYVAMMKNLSQLTEKQLLHVGHILEVIRSQICYDPVYRDHLDILDKIGREEEDRMLNCRKDLFVLLRNIGRIAPDITQVFIRNSLVSAMASSSDRNVEDVEAALSLLYALGESMSDDAMRTGSGLLGDLVPILLSTRLPGQSNRMVALVCLETMTRYMKFVQENTQYIPMLLTAFLDQRGIHHPNIKVSRRASYLFMRVVKLLKSELVPFIGTILQGLQDIVSCYTSMGYPSKEVYLSEDGSHIFEAIGVLIGMDEVPLERQTDYLSSLLTPLCRQVEVLLENAQVSNLQDPSTNILVIKQVVMAINALSKVIFFYLFMHTSRMDKLVLFLHFYGFSERLVTGSRPVIGLMFKKTLDMLLQVLVIFPKVETLRSKVASFIHRMVETLGASVFPYLPMALEQLLAESEPKEIVEFLVLLNQLICKFNMSVRDILEEVFPAIASRVFDMLPQDAFPSGPGANNEEVRELQELQRTLYTFLHVIATHDLSSVFLSSKSRIFLDPMMQLLLQTSCHHQDILIRKACVQIFIRLIKDWGNKSSCEEKVPGFQRFIVEAFATNCCLYSVLDESFEFRDANTHLLFSEIVLAHKIMYEKFGDNFLAHFVNSFLSIHCPRDMIEQYRQKLMTSDLKALKLFYRSLIENLRHQQNRSLVL